MTLAEDSEAAAEPGLKAAFYFERGQWFMETGTHKCGGYATWAEVLGVWCAISDGALTLDGEVLDGEVPGGEA